MKFGRIIEKIMMVKFTLVLFAVGLLFSVFSGIALFGPKPETYRTEGVIVGMVEDRISDSYRVFVNYTDKDGVEHTDVQYPSYHTGMEKGDIVKVDCDVNDPENIYAPGSQTVLYVVFATGIGAIIAAVVVVVRAVELKDRVKIGRDSDEM